MAATTLHIQFNFNFSLFSDFYWEREINGNEKNEIEERMKEITRAFDDANTPQFCILTLHEPSVQMKLKSLYM